MSTVARYSRGKTTKNCLSVQFVVLVSVGAPATLAPAQPALCRDPSVSFYPFFCCQWLEVLVVWAVGRSSKHWTGFLHISPYNHSMECVSQHRVRKDACAIDAITLQPLPCYKTSMLAMFHLGSSSRLPG